MPDLTAKTICRQLLLVLLFCLPQLSIANDLLKPFEVNYKLYKSGLSVAQITVILQQQEDLWLWRSDMRPASWISLFSDNRSFNKTQFMLEDEALRLKRIDLGKQANNEIVESAVFDWASRQMTTERKGKTREIPVTNPVYDYQSIHLLAGELQRSASDSKQVDFYRKGKLTTATMQHKGQEVLDYGPAQQQVEVFTLQRADSDEMLTYFYSPDQLLYPVRVEHSGPDSSGYIIILQPDKT